MQNLMTLENEELHFYSFDLDDDALISCEDNDSIVLNILNKGDFQALYDYYLEILNDSKKIYDKLLIETWMQSLTIKLDYVMNISRSLEDLTTLTQTKAYPYDVILEGMNNQKIFSYFIENGLLNLNNKVYVKKSR